MFTPNTSLTSATIRLNTRPYFDIHKGYYIWDIMFECRCSNITSTPLRLYIGNTSAEARRTFSVMLKVFTNSCIFDGNIVSILYDTKGIIAIGGNQNDCWIHIRDSFSIKSFNKLFVEIDCPTIVCNN